MVVFIWGEPRAESGPREFETGELRRGRMASRARSLDGVGVQVVRSRNTAGYRRGRGTLEEVETQQVTVADEEPWTRGRDKNLQSHDRKPVSREGNTFLTAWRGTW